MLRPDNDGKFPCAMCPETFDGVRALSTHIVKTHRKKIKEYYDIYLKEPGEGVCPVCGGPTQFRGLSDGYRKCCSHACFSKYMKSNPEKERIRQERREATSLEKYGVKNAGGAKSSIEKASRTNLEKRGVRWVMQDPSVVARSKETCIERYDATTYVHSVEGAAVVEASMLERHGRKNFFAGEEGKEAAKAGMLAAHGVDNSMRMPEVVSRRIEAERRENDGLMFVQTEKFKTMSRETQHAKFGTWYSASDEGRRRYRELMMETRGVPEFFQSGEFRDKATATLNKKYDVDNYSQTRMWKEQAEATSLKKWGARHYMQSLAARQPAMARYSGILEKWNCRLLDMDSKECVKYRCDRCGGECSEQGQLVVWRDVHGITPCTACYPKVSNVSVEETALGDFIRSLGFDVTHYDRDFIGPYGADIVVEPAKLIVEYDGLHWHSELYRDSRYHARKTMLAREMGYRLVHVFSDEWVYRGDIVKSRLRHILGAGSGSRVYARKCRVGDVTSAVEKEFLERNHIQGAVRSKWQYGLYDGDRLVALMTFGPGRFERDTVELLRFCCELDTAVVGGAGRLFAAFVDGNPGISRVVSYADARWSDDGAFYPRLGFDLVAVSVPGYFIVDGDVRHNRMRYQRHLIAGPDDVGKSEHEITLERGLYRIYDCGQYKYEWRRSR